MIVGVDVNLRSVAICSLDEHGDPSWSRLEVPSHLDALQAARALGVLAAYRDWTGASVVWLERPFGKHIRSVADLSRVFGAVLAGIPASIPVSEISPGEWKAAIGLRGNATKDEVGRWAADHLQALMGSAAPELDEPQADAYGVAMACKVGSERALRLIAGGASAGGAR